MRVDELIASARNGSTRAAGRLLTLVESPRRNEVLDALGRSNDGTNAAAEQAIGAKVKTARAVAWDGKITRGRV